MSAWGDTSGPRESLRETLAREAVELARDRAGAIRELNIDIKREAGRAQRPGYFGGRIDALEGAIVRRANTLLFYMAADAGATA